MDVISLFVRDRSGGGGGDLTAKQRNSGCVAYDPSIGTAYSYVPSLAPGIVFTAVFALCLLDHIYQTARSRKWWYISFALGALGELMGWAARLAAHWCVYNVSLFELQIAILIIAPCFFSAGLYYILAELIRSWGRQYSPLRPNLYLYIFISFDVASIVVQGVGGGLAAAAFGSIPLQSPTKGTHIMVAGICVQLAAMVAFSVLLFWTAFAARGAWRGDRRTTVLLLVTLLGDALILTRNFYRAVELGQGWTGYLITHEVFQCVLDAALMAIFVLAFIIVHPAAYMPGVPGEQQPIRVKHVSESSDEEVAYSNNSKSAHAF